MNLSPEITSTTAIAAASTADNSSILVVWDFDWSLINENSDTWVIKQLGEELMPEFRRLRREEQLGWTQIMNRQMCSLWKKGVSDVEIKWSMSRLPVFPRMLDALCLAAKAGAQQAVVSDANTVFIEEFLKHHGIRHLFGKGVSTNGGVFTDDGRLDVQPYHTNQDEPHGCSLCPPNMCKGAILDALLAVPRGEGREGRAFENVIYVGDGGGDYCPALRLRPGDLLLAREGEEGGPQYGLRQRIEEEEGGPMTCRVLPWFNGEDVHSAFVKELESVGHKSAAQETTAEHGEAGDVAEG